MLEAAVAANSEAAVDPANLKSAQSENSGIVFDKPSPFASAPKPVPETAAAAEPDPPAAYNPRISTLGSAPISMRSEEEQAAPVEESEPPNEPLGLATIPATDPAAPEPEAEDFPPMSLIDFEMTGETELPDETGASKEPDYDATVVVEVTGKSERPGETGASKELDYDATVVIESNPSLSQITKSDNSTSAFIERVKEQMSNPEPLAEDKEDPFTSTIIH